MTEAAMITARMMSMTSIGGDVGLTPNPTINTSSPTAPHKPRPTPLYRAPIQIAASTTMNCRTIDSVTMCLPSNRPRRGGYCSNFGLIRFSNANTSSHFVCVSSLRSCTTISCNDLPVS